jgi:hypothetical protein
MVMNPVRLGIKNYCAGKSQQKLSSQSVESVEPDSKYDHETRGTRNQEGLCWRELSAVYQTVQSILSFIVSNRYLATISEQTEHFVWYISSDL